VTLTDWHMSSLPVGCALLQPLKACEGVTLTGWHMLSSPVGCTLLQPFKACEGVTLTVRPATATEGVRGRDAHRPAHVVVGRSLTLLSLYCAVPTGAGRSFGAGGASRTGRATPCEGRGRPGYGGGAVVPASGTEACASEVAAGPEMETVFGGAAGAESAVVASMGICKERSARKYGIVRS